jgi:hypothetical protein
MNYRNEWPNLSGNYVTYSASYDKFVKSIAGGIGVLATYDQQGKGTINTAMLGLTYSYHQKITRKFSMLFGARAAYFQKSIDPTKLTFNDMIDRYKGFIELNKVLNILDEIELSFHLDDSNFILLENFELNPKISVSGGCRYHINSYPNGFGIALKTLNKLIFFQLNEQTFHFFDFEKTA